MSLLAKLRIFYRFPCFAKYCIYWRFVKNDYYPFGMLVPNRHGSSNSYRYGFNGKEKDDELKGIGNSYDFGARMLDPRVGRWFAVDKMRMKAPSWSPYRFGFDNPMRFIDSDGNYETDGHYWTIYMIGLLMGLEKQEAQRLAYEVEKWDTKIIGNTATLNYTWASSSHQQETHALSGGSSWYERDYTTRALLDVDITKEENLEEFGRLLHRYGDTFSHSKLSNSKEMYGNGYYTTEHMYATEPDGSSTGLRPDLIYERPDLYKKYVTGVTEILMEKYKSDKVVDLSKLNELANYASTNKVSLIGILNYEVANLNGESSFSVQYARGNFMVTDKDAHMKHVDNTKKYLDSKGIKYRTSEEYEKSSIPGRKIYLGTKFEIIE